MEPPNAFGEFKGAHDPLPLLADVLSGTRLSNDALLDLRVSVGDNPPLRYASEETTYKW